MECTNEVLTRSLTSCSAILHSQILYTVDGRFVSRAEARESREASTVGFNRPKSHQLAFRSKFFFLTQYG